MRHHSLLGIALFILLIWLVFVVVTNILGGFFHLLWILIVIAFIWWLVTMVTRRGRRPRW